MNKLLYFFLLLNFNFCFSKFAIIKDTDGFVNVRNTPKKANNISDKLNNGFIIYYFKQKNNWLSIYYKKNGKELNGFIYKDKVKYIYDYKSIPLKSNTNGQVILENNTLKIGVKETNFVKEKHKLNYLKNSSVLNKIDDSAFLGTDGGIPKREYKSIEIKINNIKVEIPKTALQNLYEPNLQNTKANYDELNDILYIQSSNSDGAGGYEIMWIIDKKKFKNRVEFYGF